MKDIGREYRQQAIKLVAICRAFAQAQKQSRSSHDEFRSVLQVVDDALYSVTEARKKKTKDANAKFAKATNALSAYEEKHHHIETVTNTMAEAEAKDKSSSSFLKRLKETMRPLKEEPTKTVEFLLHKSLPDKNPTIVKQVLSLSSNKKEILWNFSRFKDGRRLTLKDNAHFYENLPTSAENYVGQFQIDPVQTFQLENENENEKKISVLTDNPGLTGRLFLEADNKSRAFGNVWVPKEAIIFKDVCGKLEGENIIGSAIENTPNLWCFEEPSLSNASWPSLSDRSTPSPTTTATPTTDPTGALLGDWREPILRMLRSKGVKINIRISDKSPPGSSTGYSRPPSPSPSPVSSSVVDSPLSTPQSRPILELQIPGAPQGPQSPSHYETARSTPLTQQPSAVQLSPTSQAPPASNAAPPTGSAVPDPATCPLNDTTSTAAPLLVPDPTTCPPPDTSSREISQADLIPSQAGTATIFLQPHIVERRTEVEVPATRPAIPFGRGLTTNHLTNDLASGLLIPPQQPTAVPTPPRPKKHWYQKCFDVIKNTLRPGLS